MKKLKVEPDGILFGYTSRNNRLYKSINYHRVNIKSGKSQWDKSVTRLEEAMFFNTSDDGSAFAPWCSACGDLWWVEKNKPRKIGTRGERLAFFPRCASSQDPWHGYPVSALDDHNYEVPPEIIAVWEEHSIIDPITANRMRKGKI